MGGVPCRPLRRHRCRDQSRKHGVSDPGARVGNGPARVRRGRSRHGCRCRYRYWECAAPVHKSGDLCRGCGPRIGATFVRTIWSRSCGKSWSPSRTVPHVLTRPDTACAPRMIVAHFEVSDVSTIRATLGTSAITQLMFDLCSAPCKARRFAPPARARGLRALTMPARRSVFAIT